MKRRLLLLLALCIAGTASAQMDNAQQQALRTSRIKTFHKRDASRSHLQNRIPTLKLSDTPMPKSNNGIELPGKCWFPGEWEEVKAIVVTCLYNYLIPGHENDPTYSAEPIVPGVAEYYRYNLRDGWQWYGSGPYIATPDTSNDDFANAFFYVMDAIQTGHAEAWVRVEQASDSNIILRKLRRMNLHSDNIRFIVAYGNSFWFRDCGPICFYYGDQDSIGMVDFMYYPDRSLDDSLPIHIAALMGIPNYPTTIEWEGGNCLTDGAGLVISSDAIYDANADTMGSIVWDGHNAATIAFSSKQPLTHAQVRDSLAHIMGPRGAKILPAFRYDGGTGHIDLYADMTDENTFVYSKFPDYYSNWTDYGTAQRNIDSMWSYTSYFGQHYKHTSIPFPCTDAGNYFSSQTSYDENFTRTYSNHTFVNNVIIQPVFSRVSNGKPSRNWDRIRFDSLQAAYPGYTLYPINVAGFDGSGGAIHCITKQIPADNPIRILHRSITGNANYYSSTDAYIEAIVTNNSGIASVKCHWRADGGRWKELTMAPTSTPNTYAVSIPTTQLSRTSAGYNKIEYYLSATSNKGKNITKPMPARWGGDGYYTFYLGNNQPQTSITSVGNDPIGHFYPNPAREESTIDINLQDGTSWTVRIIDMNGRCVYDGRLQAEMAHFTLHTRQLASGLYHVVFTNSDGHSIVRRLSVTSNKQQ